MIPLIEIEETEPTSEKCASKGATVCSPASVSSVGSKPEKAHTPQSKHNFSDLTNLVKKKWYANESPSPSIPRSKPQLPLLVTIDESSLPLAQPKSQLPLLVPTNDVSPTRDASPPPAETIRHGSSKTIVSSEGSPAYNPSWHWPIQPYEHWSQMPAATQERTDSDSDDNKTIPFPQYVEPCVPGFDFMTGTVTEIDPNGSVPPQSDCLPPLLTGIVAPTPQSVAAPMPHNNTPYVPDNHVGVHPRDAGFNVDTNTGLCPNFSRVSIRDAELEALRATIDELTMSVDRVADERDAAIRKVWQVSYNLADAQQAVYIQEEEILEAKRVLIAEQLKTAGLEEEIERRQLKFQEKLGRLQEEQVKKAGECDMQREELREQGKLLEEAEQRVLLASKTTEALNGAAHLVVPEKQTILPCDIVSCFECYANSRECDSLARCRSCVETQSKCARWRCGMYHVLGECSSAPCKLPHSGLGWLIVQNKPEW